MNDNPFLLIRRFTNALLILELDVCSIIYSCKLQILAIKYIKE